MVCSSLLWTWLGLALVMVTSSMPTASTVGDGTEFSLSHHNATHTPLNLSSSDLDHLGDLDMGDTPVTHDTSIDEDTASSVTAADDDTASSNTATDDDTASSHTAESEDTTSSVTAADEGTASSHKVTDEETASSHTAGSENISSSDAAMTKSEEQVPSDDVPSSSGKDSSSEQTPAKMAVQGTQTATEAGSQASSTPVTRAETKTVSQMLAGAGDDETPALLYHSSPKPVATEDSPAPTEMDSSTASSPKAEIPDSPPESSVKSPSAATSPAMPIMNPSISRQPAAAIDADVSSEEIKEGLTSPGLRREQAEEEQTENEQTEDEEAEDEQMEDKQTENEKTEDETSSSEEDEDSSSEEDGVEDAADGGAVWSPPPVVNGTVREGEVASDARDRKREKNVTTFALVMCATVGATFVVLVGLWINRVRRSERLRRLQEDDDEEFTVFSARDTPYTNTAGGRYAPLR